FRIQGTLFAALDRYVRLSPFLWSEVATLHRLLGGPEAEEALGAVRTWLLGEFLNNDSAGPLVERVKDSAGMGTSSLLVHLATLPAAPPKPPPLLTLAGVAETLAGRGLRDGLAKWVDAAARRLKVQRPAAMPAAQPMPAARGPLRLSVVALRDPDVKEERF